MQCCNTFFALSNFFVTKNNPSYEISVSLIQSKNHGYPAIAEYVLNNGLLIIKLSHATRKYFINSTLSFSFFVLYSLVVSISPESLKVLHNLIVSLIINALASNSSIFSSTEHINEISFSSFGSISISYLPGITWFSSASNPLFSSSI